MAKRDTGRSEKGSAKPPSWVMTFADLMSLLLCFFILLLAFSEMDVQKFKILSGSLKMAFGVQRAKPAWDMAKGTDIISDQFNDPQFTEDAIKRQLRSAIRRMNLQGTVKIEEDEVSVRVSLPNRVLFGTGSAGLKEEAVPILDQLHEVIAKMPHRVMVVGHTDNVPIHTPQFPSNWELSAARAASVIRHLLDTGSVPPDRYAAVGRADTVPVAPNDSPENRARNRRVELIFQKKVAIHHPHKGRSKKFKKPINLDPLGDQRSGSRRIWHW